MLLHAIRDRFKTISNIHFGAFGHCSSHHGDFSTYLCSYNAFLYIYHDHVLCLFYVHIAHNRDHDYHVLDPVNDLHLDDVLDHGVFSYVFSQNDHEDSVDDAWGDNDRV